LSQLRTRNTFLDISGILSAFLIDKPGLKRNFVDERATARVMMSGCTPRAEAPRGVLWQSGVDEGPSGTHRQGYVCEVMRSNCATGEVAHRTCRKEVSMQVSGMKTFIDVGPCATEPARMRHGAFGVLRFGGDAGLPTGGGQIHLVDAENNRFRGLGVGLGGAGR
jgi:hypothetical protein